MKIKQYIKSLGFAWTDLTIIPFFVFTILLVLEDVNLMWIDAEVGLSQPFWTFLLYTIIGFLSLLAFFFFECRNKRKPSIIALSILILVIIFNFVAIYINPSSISINLYDMENNPFKITVPITSNVAFVHFISFLFFASALFIWVFIIPKKFNNLNFIVLIPIVFHLLSLFVFIYSLINDDYVFYFSKLFGTLEDFDKIKGFIPYSIFGNSNVYAFYLELGIFFTLFHYSLKHWKIDFIFLFIYYVLLLLTICKTGILITSGLLLVFFIVLFIKSLINKNTVAIVLSSAIFLIMGEIVLFMIKNYFYCENIRNKIEYLFVRADSFSGRTVIWHVGQQLSNIKPFFGLGHGVYNNLLFNGVNQILEPGAISSHNSYLTLLGEGGIVYLTSFIILNAYSLVLIAKMIKKHFDTSISLTFGLLLFLGHSFFEDIYYYTELIIVFIAISYNVYMHRNVEQKEPLINKEAQA